MADFAILAQYLAMPIKLDRTTQIPKSRHYIREWRKFRGLTLEQVALRIDISPEQISKIERAQQGYRQDTLEMFAYALGCEPADLLRPTPDAKEAEVIDLLRHLKGPQKAMAIDMLRGLLQSAGGAAK